MKIRASAGANLDGRPNLVVWIYFQTMSRGGFGMNVLHDLVKDAPLPRLIKIHQKFDAPEIADVPQTLRVELAKTGVGDRIKPGMSIAIAVGSPLRRAAINREL